jgi:hypothetical protein
VCGVTGVESRTTQALRHRSHRQRSSANVRRFMPVWLPPICVRLVTVCMCVCVECVQDPGTVEWICSGVRGRGIPPPWRGARVGNMQAHTHTHTQQTHVCKLARCSASKNGWLHRATFHRMICTDPVLTVLIICHPLLGIQSLTNCGAIESSDSPMSASLLENIPSTDI